MLYLRDSYDWVEFLRPHMVPVNNLREGPLVFQIDARGLVYQDNSLDAKRGWYGQGGEMGVSLLIS